MAQISFKQFRIVLVLIVLSSFLVSCTSSANNRYFGQTSAPKDNVLRYVTGSEPESIDPQIGTGQPEARIYMALYDGLVEYHPKTMEPIPSIAESWEPSTDGTEYLFHLRKNAKFSNGDPIKASDFVYTFRRALSPDVASRNAILAYYIKYAEAYNSVQSFVKDSNGQFLLKKDFAEEAPNQAVQAVVPHDTLGGDSPFHQYIDSPERLYVPSVPFDLAKTIEGNEKLKTAFKFNAKDLKDVPGLANKLKNSSDELSNLIKAKVNQNALNACAAPDTCTDAAKQEIADGLNNVLTGDSIYAPDRFASIPLSDDSQKFLKAVDAANKKIDTDNQAIDADIAKLTDETQKQEKAKKKKKNITKLFYLNRFLLEDIYRDNLEKTALVPVKAEDIGVEAVDDYTLRVKLYQPAPFFLGLLAHQLFRVLHQPTIEKYGANWTKPENIVTSGSFKLSVHKPYDELDVVRDPNNWDAANVKLDGIEFYPIDEQTTMMNLYKAGKVDALYNHTVPGAWIDVIKQYKDEYLLHPEVATEFYVINVKKPPMDNLKVRQAFALAIDRVALAEYRKTIKPLSDMTPEGIFPKYEEARTKVYAQKLKENNISEEEWAKRGFNPEKGRKLLAEAGFPVVQSGNTYTCPTFPVDKVNITYNTAESNKAVAEFVQAQWKQNLGITVPLKNLEFRTYLPLLSSVDYEGFGRRGWVGDYMDPFTFLGLYYTQANDGATGWWDPKFDKMLDEANNTVDEMKRYEKLAEAEFYVSQQQIIIPLSTNGTSWMKKPYVKGLYPNPGTLHAWKFVYIERDPNKWDTNVDNIMKTSDAAVDQQISQLRATQDQMEKSKSTETAVKPNTTKVE
ncbi:MAG TPA: ABC transporter substrate-binding protein [Pyrinomonadaceae bacterium]|jgi:oligopeptide transport system substrate-binding protein